MTLREYAAFVEKFWIYGNGDCGGIPEIPFIALAIGGETGEVLGKLSAGLYSTSRRRIDGRERLAIANELGDILFYVTRLFQVCSGKIYTSRAIALWDVVSKRGAITSAIALGATAGQVQEIVKKVWRDENGEMSEEANERVKIALENLLFDFVCFAKSYGLTEQNVINANVAKLTSRARRGVLQGSGDDR